MVNVSIAGIRFHDNIKSKWFSVYPEKEPASCTVGKGAAALVFGGYNNLSVPINIRGELYTGDGNFIINYVATVQPKTYHVFEQTFEMPNNDLDLTVLVAQEPFNPQSLPVSFRFSVSHVPAPEPTEPPTSGDQPPQPQPEPTPTPAPMPNLPTVPPVLDEVFTWLKKASFPDLKLFNMSGIDFGNMLGTVGKALGDTITKPLENLPTLINSLNGLPDTVFNLLGGIVGDLINGLFETGSDIMSGRILSTLKGTPDSVKSVLDIIPFGAGNSFSKYVNITNPEAYLSQVSQGGDVMPAIRQQVTDSINLLREMDQINFGLSLASLGQVRVVADEIQMLEGMFGAGALIHNFNTIRQEKAVTKRIEYYFNEVYQPEIPNTQDLINMVVKEKMSLGDFKNYMLKRGFNNSWSQLIWDAHFKAPDLDDILTAWRRGVIDESRVDELMILIDLDPRFKEIFDTRKYNDPSLMNIRLMFETGAITAEDVPVYVHRLGFVPEFETAITEFLLHFQERRYKTRYITQLMTALAQEKATEDEVKAAVIEIGFTEATADIIIKTSLLRRRTYKTATTTTTEKALSLSELKKAYVEDIISEDQFRANMLSRGYNQTDIDVLIALTNKDKIVETEGRRVIVLTVAEMVSAWRYSVITEDELRTNLLSRGLDLNEIDILIKTKKASWGLTTGAD